MVEIDLAASKLALESHGAFITAQSTMTCGPSLLWRGTCGMLF